MYQVPTGAVAVCTGCVPLQSLQAAAGSTFVTAAIILVYDQPHQLLWSLLVIGADTSALCAQYAAP
jgi:hypothetical protein